MRTKYSHWKVFPCTYFCIISAICLLVCNVFHVSATGPYMSAFWGIMRNKKNPSAAGISPLSSIKIQNEGEELKEIDEYYSKCNGIEIRELTILQVQHLFATKQLTSVELTNCYLARIHRMNPILNAVIQVNQDAIKQAYQADVKLSEAGLLYDGDPSQSDNSLMLGIPILLKDNIDTKDYMETTAGSPALVGLRPKRDATVVKALRKAGAVILGKANLSEFAKGTNIPSGWSGRGGQTKNAYNLGVDPQGSSSGSAVAVSANLAMVSLGTETDGSLLAPASVAGLFTIKCTLGNPSTKGVIPISHNQDNVGPMTRSVMDMVILLDTIRPAESRVNSASKIPMCEKGYVECLGKTNKQKKIRVGIVRYPFWDNSVINSTDLDDELPILEDNLRVLKSSEYFDIVDPVDYSIDLLSSITGTKEFLVFSHDFKHEINEYLKNDVTSLEEPRTINSLADIIKYNDEHPNSEGYNQNTLIASEATDGILNETYVEAKKSNRLAAQKLLNYLMTTYNLDAVMTPSLPWIYDVNDSRLHDTPVRGWSIAAISGYPSINVPAGTDSDGVPFGVTVIGKLHTEAELIRIAQLMEQLTPRRHLPTFLVSV